MSIGSWIRGWRLDKAFKHLFSKKDTPLINDAIEKAVILVNNIKDFTHSKDIEFYEALIPGDWDTSLKDKVKNVLPTVLLALSQGQECASEKTLALQLACVLKAVKGITKDEKTTFFNRLAAAFAKVFSDGKIDMSDAIILVEVAYREIFKKK